MAHLVETSIPASDFRTHKGAGIHGLTLRYYIPHAYLNVYTANPIGDPSDIWSITLSKSLKTAVIKYNDGTTKKINVYGLIVKAPDWLGAEKLLTTPRYESDAHCQSRDVDAIFARLKSGAAQIMLAKARAELGK